MFFLTDVSAHFGHGATFWPFSAKPPLFGPVWHCWLYKKGKSLFSLSPLPCHTHAPSVMRGLLCKSLQTCHYQYHPQSWGWSTPDVNLGTVWSMHPFSHEGVALQVIADAWLCSATFSHEGGVPQMSIWGLLAPPCPLHSWRGLFCKTLQTCAYMMPPSVMRVVYPRCQSGDHHIWVTALIVSAVAAQGWQGAGPR